MSKGWRIISSLTKGAPMKITVAVLLAAVRHAYTHFGCVLVNKIGQIKENR